MTLHGPVSLPVVPKPVPDPQPAPPMKGVPVEQSQQRATRKRKRRKRGWGNDIGKSVSAAAPVLTGVQAARLLVHVRRARHRSAVLDFLANMVVPAFTPSSSTTPRYLIENGEGLVEPADVETVLSVAAELHALAEAERQALQKLLAADLNTVELPPADDGEPEPDLMSASVTDNTPSRGASR
jgi:hypothetical protein